MGQIIVNQKKCTRCGICRDVCPARIIELPADAACPRIPDEKSGSCINCGHCEVFCPSGALTHEYSVCCGQPTVYRNPGITAEQLELYIKSRRSVRNFTDQLAEKETLEKLMGIVRYAPTAVNLQQVKWVIVHDPDKTRELARLSVDWMRHLIETDAPMADMLGATAAIEAWENGADTIFRHAPHLAAVYAPDDNSFAEKDAMIALSYLDLTLPSFGLGGFWTGYFKFAADAWPPILKELGIPEGHHIVYALAFGYQKYPVTGIPARKQPDILWK